MITIVGMGTGSEDTLTAAALKKARTAGTVVLQTGSVDTARFLADEGVSFLTLDGLYEKAADFDELCESTVAFFADKPDAAFFVMGSASGNALAGAVMKSYECGALPGVSFGSYALDLCGIYSPYASSFAAADIEGAYISAEYPIAVTEISDEYTASDVVLAFQRYYPYDSSVFFIKGGRAERLPLCDIARRTDFSYDCAIVFPGLELKEREGYTFEELVKVIAVLRGEGGCPWDREQTHESLRKNLLEESLEAIDAIDKKDPDMLYDELGDVLLQVVLHAQIASEHADFDSRDVTTSECKKMISRHTHIFGEDKIDTADGVLANWDKIKRAEKGEGTLAESMRDVTDISALMKAEKVQKKAALQGFDWPDAKGALAKVREEADEIEDSIDDAEKREGECGDLLFAAVNLLRKLRISPDIALAHATDKFIARYEFMEKRAAEAGEKLSEMPLERMEQLWGLAKENEKAGCV